MNFFLSYRNPHPQEIPIPLNKEMDIFVELYNIITLLQDLLLFTVI